MLRTGDNVHGGMCLLTAVLVGATNAAVFGTYIAASIPSRMFMIVIEESKRVDVEVVVVLYGVSNK